MNRKWILLLLLAVFLCLAGCSSTVYEMYQLPKRSEQFANLQTVMDEVMVGLEYSAPLSGENQQTVQMADLNGDDSMEYILFAKGTSDKPLQIFIFSSEGDQFTLLDTISCNGSAFEQVEYIQMDNRPGLEIVVGRQVSEQVLRSVSVYTMVRDSMEHLLAANYSRFICCDLNRDSSDELLLLRPGTSDADSGVAELFAIKDGKILRSTEVLMSAPAEKIKRIILGKLHDGVSAVFVASDVDGSAIVTDIYALVDDKLINVAFQNELGTSVKTLRNYYVYADDIDNDGILELPSLIDMHALPKQTVSENQHIIRWYAMKSDGSEVNKMYTYHNFMGGWYLELDSDLASKFTVIQLGNAFEFHIWDKENNRAEKLLTIYALTGQKREELAMENNRFVVYRGESTVYAANLEGVSSMYDITKEGITSSFHLILQDWKTGET